jgi:hypothetical protein
MDSALAKEAREKLIESARRMTLAQRLKAFVEHSRLMIRLREAGRRLSHRQNSSSSD